MIGAEVGTVVGVTVGAPVGVDPASSGYDMGSAAGSPIAIYDGGSATSGSPLIDLGEAE